MQRMVGKKNQKEFESDLGDILKQSPETKSIKNMQQLYKRREKVIKF